ncbi:dnaJ homolog subfamily C member 9 [Hydra vulgaris]|uniref:DnaJ homolog subfamily C member 9 n=1 Tax=Hydra vulgaris TaxID=6087 RepID=T2M8U7_HYDVU|nr:dnaJ homolog subfamily C member 9 [Hydra vulgaris]
MSFFDDVERYFNTRCLYTAIEVQVNADNAELKKAYHKLSLRYHPDRSSVQDKDINKCKFQTLSKIHSILSNKESRAVYDETGELIDDDSLQNKDCDWDSYWRQLFKKITKKDIEKFEEEFKGSEKEAEEIKAYYIRFEGDMDEILNNVMCSTAEDETRFRKIITNLIEKKEVPEFDNFSKEDPQKIKLRKIRAEKEKKEAEQHANDIGLKTDDTLENLILQRQVDRSKEMNNFFNNLEAKYGQPKAKKSKKLTTDAPIKNAANATSKKVATKRKRK